MNSAPSFTTASLLVLVGGGIGAWLRLMTARLWLSAIGPIAVATFPWATLTANVGGSFCMGLLVGWLARHNNGGDTWQLLLGVGLLGGYTTFSSFALEFALFVERGNLGLAALYVGVSLAAGFTALFAGLFLIRALA